MAMAIKPPPPSRPRVSPAWTHSIVPPQAEQGRRRELLRRATSASSKSGEASSRSFSASSSGPDRADNRSRQSLQAVCFVLNTSKE